MHDTDCIFCKIAVGEIPAMRLGENALALAFMDVKPIHPGHALVIPKDHHADLLAIPPETLAAMATLAQKTAAAISAGLAPDGINLVMNNGIAAGQAVFHAHLHVIPRYDGDGFEQWHGTEQSKDVLIEAAEKIKAAY